MGLFYAPAPETHFIFISPSSTLRGKKIRWANNQIGMA
jgi:hypothetical protein